MMMVMVTMVVNICDDDCDLVMKVTLVKEVMSCDVLPVAIFYLDKPKTGIFLASFVFLKSLTPTIT